MSNIIVCDLDGTLIKSDMLLESVFILIKKNPIFIFLLPIWLLKGKAQLKDEINKRIEFNAELLPYNQDVIDFLDKKKSEGNKIILATASNQNIATKISNYLGIFDETYGSTSELNLKSKNKRDFLNEKYGKNQYSYVGDSTADLKVWEDSKDAYVMNNGISDKNKISNLKEIIGEKSKSKLKLIIKEIRVYQWVKNLLLFIPALMAHKTDLDFYFTILIAFISFSLLASSVYVLNDLLDLDADRQHPRKKNRPFASGNLSLLYGFVLLPILIAISFALSLIYLPYEFTLTLLVYYLITNLYSFKLKRLELIDIITLASLYTIRIISGGYAVDVLISPWLLAFSMFLFLSLALLKRYTELLSMIKENKVKATGRGYHVEDIDMIRGFGTSSAYIAILVYALYAYSDQVQVLYNKPSLMWLVAVLLLYWITRIWFLAHRGKMTDDPIVFTGKDPNSWIVGLIIGILMLWAKV